MNKRIIVFGSVLALTVAGWTAAGQTAPPPESWPPTINPDVVVHYVVTDSGLDAPSGNWTPDLTILSGGDQGTADINIGGFTGKKVTGSFLNVADALFDEWADDEFIDILVQAYGDGGLFNAQGQPRNYTFLTGVLPNLNFPVGGQVPLEARNGKWNWILFRIPNDFRPDGTRFVGSIPDGAGAGSGFGGVNGGTIRFEGAGNLTVRVIAFGPEGAFGSPEDFATFAPPETCDPEPETNLASIDINTDSANHVQVLNDGDQTVTFEQNVGPAADRRRVVRPDGIYLNFGITDNYLGKPCNDPHAIKVCVDFYDDPDFAGFEVRFGPEAFATDAQSGIDFYPEAQRHVLQGTGEWIRRSWTIPAVNLRGVNAGSLTAGPRFISENGQVAVSRFEVAVLREGDHPLAGQDPLAGCVEDPLICTDAYGQFVELDLGQDIRDGLDVGSSGGDQNMIVDEAGPPNDRRMAVRPAFDDGAPGFVHRYLNFAILDQALGPNSQPPAHLAICLTYYDDPDLVGATLRPEVYQTVRNGVQTLGFTPGSIAVALEGTGTWRDAYWEITDMKFNGVNQGPQAAARFVASDGGKIFVTRLRYAVIRPCGPDAGVNLLEECKPPPADVLLSAALTANGLVRVSWPADAEGFVLQGADTVGGTWQTVEDAPAVEGDELVVTVTPTGSRFYRLSQP